MSLPSVLREYHIPFVRTPRSPEICLVCPQCKQEQRHKWDHPGLWFNTDKKVGQCFRCGWKGKEAALLSTLGIRLKAPLALEFPEQTTTTKRVTKNVSPFPMEAIPALQYKEARKYLYGRGLTEEEIERFGLCYCPEGFYQRRVIIPICDRHGVYTTFTARSIDANATKKYLFPKGAHVSQLVYNLHFMHQRTSVWLHEGCFDAIHCFPYGTALFGKHISAAQITCLRLAGITTVYLLLDAEAWQKTPQEYANVVYRLRQHFLTFSIKLEHSTVTEYKVGYLQELCQRAL